jgi:hypothetical protein
MSDETKKKEETSFEMALAASKLINLEESFRDSTNSIEHEIKLLKKLYKQIKENFNYVSEICKAPRKRKEFDLIDGKPELSEEKKPWNALYSILEQLLNIRKLIADHLKEKTTISKLRLDFTLKEYSVVLKKFLSENKGTASEQTEAFFLDVIKNIQKLSDKKDFSFDSDDFEHDEKDENNEDEDSEDEEERLLEERLNKKKKKISTRQKIKNLLKENKIVKSSKSGKLYFEDVNGFFKKIKPKWEKYLDIMEVDGISYIKDTAEEIEEKKIPKSSIIK